MIDAIFDFWASTAGLTVAPSSTTRAGLIDELMAAKRIDTSRQLPMVHHSLLCASVEFGNLVPAYDNAWLNILNELYDNRKLYQDTTRKLGKLTIEHPHMVIIAGTQPKYLDNLLPEAAFGMGFMSRFIMVYVSEAIPTPMFSHVRRANGMRDYLLEDLTSITKLSGEYFLSPEAQELYEGLYAKGFPPIPEHPKLQHYNTRRPAHLLKMMMCFAAAESNSFKILPQHIEKAVALLHETETVMPQIFAEMVSKGYADANDEAWAFAMQTWLQNGRKPIPETKLIGFLYGKVPNAHIKPTIDTMVQAGYLQKTLASAGGQTYNVYVPLAKGDRK